MRKILFSFLIVIATSCGGYHAMMNESIKFKNDSIAYFKDSNMQLLPVRINNVDHEFLFDTGAGVAMLNVPKFNLDGIKSIEKRNVRGFDKKAKSKVQSYTLDSLSTGLYTITKKYIYYGAVPTSICGNKIYDGILDRVSPPEGFMTELNYEKGYLKFVKEPDLKAYGKLDARFNIANGTFSIKLNVNGTDAYFLFDTGNSSSLLMIDTKDFKNIPEKIYSVNTTVFGVNGIIVPCLVDVHKGEFQMGDLTFERYISVNHSTAQNNVNMAFIKSFNWLLDEQNNKVYYQPINKELLTLKRDYKILPAPTLRAGIYNQKLLVAYSNFDSEKFSLNDEIIEVEEQKVDLSNICSIGELLNKTKDWNTLSIKTIPAITGK